MTGAGRVTFVRPGPADGIRLGADRMWHLGGPASEDARFSVVLLEGAPGVPGPPLHLHRTFEEAWYLLDGKVAFTAAGTTLHATPGTYLHVPPGVEHTFEVEGATTARWVGIFAPGKFVGLLTDLAGVLRPDGPPDPDALRAVFRKFDTELAPTP